MRSGVCLGLRHTFQVFSYLIWARFSKLVPKLFSPIHPLNVCLVMCLKFFAFQLEGIRHQTSFRSPWVRAQTNFYWNFKLFQTCCDDKNKRKHNNKNSHTLRTPSKFSAKSTVLRGIPTKYPNKQAIHQYQSHFSTSNIQVSETWEL